MFNAFPGVRLTRRLKASKMSGVGGRITQAIALTRPSDVDSEAKESLEAEYAVDAD